MNLRLTTLVLIAAGSFHMTTALAQACDACSSTIIKFDPAEYTRMMASFSSNLYLLKPNGDLLWAPTRICRESDDFKDVRYEFTGGGRKITNLARYRAPFIAPHDFIYAVGKADGALYMWRFNPSGNDGSGSWRLGRSRKVGIGWGSFRTIFASTDQIVYAVTRDGSLLWYKHTGQPDGRFSWDPKSRTNVGPFDDEGHPVINWADFKYVMARGDGVIVAYEEKDTGEKSLKYFIHTGYRDASSQWYEYESGDYFTFLPFWGDSQDMASGGEVLLEDNGSAPLLYQRLANGNLRAMTFGGPYTASWNDIQSSCISGNPWPEVAPADTE